MTKLEIDSEMGAVVELELALEMMRREPNLPSDVARCLSLAITKAQECRMWLSEAGKNLA